MIKLHCSEILSFQRFCLRGVPIVSQFLSTILQCCKCGKDKSHVRYGKSGRFSIKRECIISALLLICVGSLSKEEWFDFEASFSRKEMLRIDNYVVSLSFSIVVVPLPWYLFHSRHCFWDLSFLQMAFWALLPKSCSRHTRETASRPR